jgi:hypothetical protein
MTRNPAETSAPRKGPGHRCCMAVVSSCREMAGTTGCETARWSKSLKAGLSSDCRLQLAYMKPELLVTAGQHTAVNMFPGLVHTARHVMKAGNTRSRWANPQGRQPSKVGSVIGTKS